MKNTLAVTLAVLLLGGGFLIAYDAWLATTYGVEATISWKTYQLGKSEPIIPFATGMLVGVLAGHFWWRVGG